MEQTINFKNVIFKNLINKIIGNYSPLFYRHKFLNIFWMIEKIESQLKSNLLGNKVKISNITSLFPFTIKMIDREICNNNNYKDSANFKKMYKETISKLEEFNLKYNQNKIDDNSKFELLENLKKYKNKKRAFCERSYKQLRWIYNNSEIKSVIDIEKINDALYHFISTRLMWGFSWRQIKNSLSRFSKKNNFWNEDLISKILPLQTKHHRKEYTVYIPINIENIDNFKIWIDNFNEVNNKTKIIHGTKIEEKITEKTAKNLQRINLNKFYVKHKTSQLDDYAAIGEVLNRVVPIKFGIISSLKKIIFLSEDNSILVTCEWNQKQYFNSVNLYNFNSSSLFANDFIIIPELKYKKQRKELGNIWKRIFSFIYQNENWNKLEHKYMATYLLLENSEKLINSLPFKSKSHKIILRIALIDASIEFYINNAFAVKKHFSQNINKKYKNDLEFLEDFIQKNKKYKDFYEEYTNRNILPSKDEMKVIFSSLEYFKNLAAQTRNKIMHEGKKIDFFDLLAVETLDSILTLSILRIFNKKLNSESDIDSQYKLLDKLNKENNFEILKKVL